MLSRVGILLQYTGAIARVWPACCQAWLALGQWWLSCQSNGGLLSILNNRWLTAHVRCDIGMGLACEQWLHGDPVTRYKWPESNNRCIWGLWELFSSCGVAMSASYCETLKGNENWVSRLKTQKKNSVNNQPCDPDLMLIITEMRNHHIIQYARHVLLSLCMWPSWHATLESMQPCGGLSLWPVTCLSSEACWIFLCNITLHVAKWNDKS